MKYNSKQQSSSSHSILYDHDLETSEVIRAKFLIFRVHIRTVSLKT